MSRSVARLRKTLLVLNPVAGQAYSNDIRRAFGLLFPANEWTIDIHETTGPESIEAMVRDACRTGVDLVVAGQFAKTPLAEKLCTES